ncbi:MAG TPA: hypothetical protein VKM93_00275 [Terriglobia bacterium]|nr:hypothetical protein [Terriglobia bacterium]
MEATNGATLELYGDTYTNTNGTIHADDASAVVLYSNTIRGGQFTTTGSGAIYGEYATLDGTGGQPLTNAGHFSVPNGYYDYVQGTVNNTGSITLDSSTTYAQVFLTADTTLQGGGTVTLSNSPYNLIRSSGGPFTLTNQNNTIQGVGTITANVINGGTIVAGSGGTPGQLIITGNYTQTGTGVYNELIGSSSSNGLLNISGNTTLDSGAALTINLLGGFDPSNGTTFTILDGTTTGQFNISDPLFGPGNDQKWVISYNGGDGDDVILTAESNSVSAGTVNASWIPPAGSGNWTTATQWSCTPGAPTCVPNNGGGTVYDTTLNDPGKTLTLPAGNSITVDTLSLQGGTLVIQATASLDLANQPNGITDIPSGAGLDVAGTFTAGANSALASLTSVEGNLTLENAQTTATTPNGGTLNVASTGDLRVDGGSTLMVNGDLTNSGFVYTGVGTTGNTLNVTGAFTNNANAQAYIGYSASTGDVANVGALTNDGYLQIGSGATLNITGGAQGVTDVVAGSTLLLYGTLNFGAQSGLANLTSVEGYLEIGNGQTTNDAPNGGTLTVANTGDMRVNYGSTLNATGNLTNSGLFYTGVGTSGNTLNVTGTFTNNANAQAYIGYSASTGDIANVGALTNDGYLQIGSGATLNITGGGQGVTDVVAGSTLLLYGTLNLGAQSGLGNLTSVEGYLEIGNGQITNDAPNGGTLTVANTGDMRVNYGSTLNVTGNLTNSVYLYTGVSGGAGNTLNVSGAFTNNGQTYVGYSNTGDIANVGSLANNGYLQVTSATLNITGSTDTNSGNVTLYGGTLSSPSAGGNFDNTGTVSTHLGSPASTISIGGTFTNEALANLTLNNSGDVTKIGSLANGGTVNVAAGALLGVGTGSFTATSGYQQLANGTLTEIIGSASTFGVLNITGPASLAGALAIGPLSFNPNGDSFDILNFTTGGLTGTFSNGMNFSADGYNWTLSYNSNDVVLSAGVIPTSVAATWSTGSGNWTNPAEWSCNPSYSPCTPNNNSLTTFSAAVNSPGNTLTLDNTSSTTSITINSLSLVAGNLTIGSGATLNLVSQPNGITDIPVNAGLDVAGSFTVGGSTSALANLGSVEGTLTLENGQTTSVTPGTSPCGVGCLQNSGTINVQQSSTLAVTGVLTNSGAINTGDGVSDTGNNQVTISGSGVFNNSGSITLSGPGDSLSAAPPTDDRPDLNNTGSIGLIGNSETLTVTGDLNNNGGLLFLSGFTDKVTVAENLTNTGTLKMNGTSGSISVTGSLTNGGTITIGGNGNTFTIDTWSNLSNTGELSGGGTYDVAGLFQYTAPANGISTIDSGVDVTLRPGGLVTPGGGVDALAGLTTNAGFVQLVSYNESFTPGVGSFSNSGELVLTNLSGAPTSLTVTGNFDNSGVTETNGASAAQSLMVTGNSSNENLIEMTGNGDDFTTAGTLTNSGNILLEGVGESLTADLTNTGAIELLANNQTLIDTGDLNNNGGALNIGAADGSVRVAGNFVNNGGSLSLNIRAADGSVRVAGNFVNNGGTLNISAADGSVRVADNFVNGAGGVGGTLLPAVQLNGDHDSLTVGGTFTNDANALVAMNGTNGSISVTGKFTNNGTINLGGSNNSLTADFDNSGPITLSGNGDSLTDLGDFNNNSGGSLSLTADSDQVTVATNFNNNPGASVTMSGTNGTLMTAVAFINGGTVTLSGSGDTLTAGSFTNTGTVSIGVNETVNLPAVQQPGTYTQTGGSTTVNGTLTAGGGVSLQGGSLLGAGRINGNVNNSGGSVEPASAPGVPGKLVINGSYTQGPSGTLTIDINALNSLSVLDVLGAGSLDGNVTFDFGFTPSAGETFTFLTAEAGNLAGVFASDTFNGFGCATCTLDYNYGNGSVTLDINGTAPTPEPSAWLMLGTALLAMVAYVMMQRRSGKDTLTC